MMSVKVIYQHKWLNTATKLNLYIDFSIGIIILVDLNKTQGKG